MALRNRYDKTKVIKRPAKMDAGIPPSPNDKLVQFSVEYGSQRLLSALRREHPGIVNYFVAKNGNGMGQPVTIPEYDNRT